MISEEQAKRFCREPLENIENYVAAMADTTHKWDCHHRRELDDGVVRSVSDMMELGLYWHRPASELIFLTHSEHASLHNKGNYNSNYGKHHSEETKKKMSAANKGRLNGMKWWNNGITTKRAKECPGPEWKPGRKYQV